MDVIVFQGANRLESIVSSHQAFQISTGYGSAYHGISHSTVESAETIVQCSKHMKTIVDGMYNCFEKDLRYYANIDMGDRCLDYIKT